MTSVLLAGAVVALSFVVMSRQRIVSIPVVLRILPAALLFLTLPAASSAYWLVNGFREVSQSGTSGGVPTLLDSVCSTMLLGSIALLGTMLGAAIWITAGTSGPSAATLSITDIAVPAAVEPSPEAGIVQPALGGFRWFALLSPLALIPAVLVAVLLADVSSLVMQAKVALSGRTEGVSVAGMNMSELAGYISARLIVTFGVGALCSIGLALAALLNLLPIYRGSVTGGTRKYGWIVAGITSAAAVWLAVRFALVLTTIARSQ